VHIPQAAGATPPLHGAMIIKPLQGLGRLRRYQIRDFSKKHSIGGDEASRPMECFCSSGFSSEGRGVCRGYSTKRRILERYVLLQMHYTLLRCQNEWI
jgi:hypothetical protein